MSVARNPIAVICFCLGLMGGVPLLWGQSRPAPAGPVAPPLNATELNYGPGNYILTPQDQLRISVFGAPDMDTTARVDASGQINVPLLGALHVAGESVNDLQDRLARLWDRQYLQDAEVSIFLMEIHGANVVVTGAVQNPGVQQLLQPRTLSEVVAKAGGFGSDAGGSVILSRPGKPDLTISIRDLLGGKAPPVEVAAGDTVRVPQAAMVYVLGAVIKSGSFPISANQNISVLRALALAQGLTATASHQIGILHRSASGDHLQQVELNPIMQGKKPDIMLRANDIVVVPESTGKVAMAKAVAAAITGVPLYLVYHP